MKLLIIGAAGKTGQAIVKEALAAGHEVTAFVHDAAGYNQPGVRLIEADATDPAKMNEAIAGQDAVLDAIGGHTPWKQTSLDDNVARVVITAMRSHAVRRLLVVSALGTGESMANASFLYEHLVAPTFLRGALADKTAMEATIEATDLDWTIVRAAVLTDDRATGNVRVYSVEGESETQAGSTDAPHETAHKIARADVAVFLLRQLTSSQYSRKLVTIATS